MILQVERRCDAGQVECADIGLFQCGELVLASAILGPDAQIGEGCIIFVDPAVVIAIELTQIGKAVAGGCSK